VSDQGKVIEEYSNVLESGERPFAVILRRDGGNFEVEKGNNYGFKSTAEFSTYYFARRAARLWCGLNPE